MEGVVLAYVIKDDVKSCMGTMIRDDAEGAPL